MPPFDGPPEGPAPCAVIGCKTPGRAHRCPYDGTVHHHGRIHYECHKRHTWAPQSTLEFYPDAWMLICDPHHAQILGEIDEARRIARAEAERLARKDD